MTAYMFRMPAGIPGDVNRVQHATIEAQLIHALLPPLVYGIPLVMDDTSHAVRALAAGDTGDLIYGFLVRPYPTQSFSWNDPLGTGGSPATSGFASVMRRGYMSVALGGVAAAVKNGVVYARIAVPATGKPLGGIEAASDTVNTVVVPNAYFMGPADASGNTEIAFNI